MNNKLYGVRCGVRHYTQLINESLIDQETWRDMVRGAIGLCYEIQSEPKCRENPIMLELLMNSIANVLLETKDCFSDSDSVRELVLVSRTKNTLEQVISGIQQLVDEIYPEGAESG